LSLLLLQSTLLILQVEMAAEGVGAKTNIKKIILLVELMPNAG
jgi:hypothetical protein